MGSATGEVQERRGGVHEERIIAGREVRKFRKFLEKCPRWYAVTQVFRGQRDCVSAFAPRH